MEIIGTGTFTLRRLQVDLVSHCNAACPICSRQNSQGALNAFFPANRSLPLDIFAKALADPALQNLEEVFFCGNYGDALAAPHLLRYLDALDSPRPIRWNIHTNGSMGSRETWRELARRSQRKGRLVKFSIDGLADTNEKYRRGTSWEKIMRNCELFLGEGGRGVWKFVRFPHNAHQVEEAEALAKKMGFLRFEPRANYSPELESLLYSPTTRGEEETDETPKNLFREVTRIDCQAQRDSTLYLDFAGQLWPCCWIADWKYSPSSSLRRWHQEKRPSSWRGEFNSLQKHTIEEIVRVWRGPQNRPESFHPACGKYCGLKA